MSDLNKFIGQGNLVSDPKFFGTKENPVARFAIAMNDGYGDRRETTYVECVAFGKQVDVIRQYFKKGKQVVINGKLKQSRWETPEGESRSRLEVRLDNYDGFFFTGKRDSEEASLGDIDVDQEVVEVSSEEENLF